MAHTGSHAVALEFAPLPDHWHLGRVSRRILEEMADAMLPDEGRNEQVRSHVVRYIDAWVPHMPTLFRKLFPVGLFLLQWGTIVSLTAILPFTLASSRVRRRYLAAWERSPFPVFRALFGGVRGLVMSAYYALPNVYRRIGYEPEAYVEECKKRRAELVARHGDGDTHTASMIFEEIGRGGRDGSA